MALDKTSIRTESTTDVSVQAIQSGTWTEANSASIKTAVETIDNFISGSRGLVTEDNSAAIKTSVELIDDAVATDGSAATTKLLQVGGTDGTNAQIISTNATGHVNIADGGNSITVDGTVAVSGTVTVDTELPAAAALADNASNPTAPAVGAFGMLWDGATWDRAKGDSTDGMLVNLGSNNDVTVTSGTVTVTQGTATNLKTQAELYVGGTAVSTSAPVPVVIQDEASTAPTYAKYVASSALAAQASATLSGDVLAASKTGRLKQVVVSSENPWKAEVQKFDESAASTTVAMLFGDAGETVIFEPKTPRAALFELASDGTPTAKFQVVVTNNNASSIGASAPIYTTIQWEEE